MAKDKTVAGYEIRVEGEFYSKNASGVKTINQYDVMSFDLPEIITYVDGREKIETITDGKASTRSIPKVHKGNATRVGLHIIRRYYLQSALKEKYPGFTGIRTCEIFSITPKRVAPSNKKIQDMTASEVKQFVMLSDLNMELSAYGDLGSMKNAVERAVRSKAKDDKLAGKTAEMSREEAALLPADGIQSDDNEGDHLGSLA